MNRPFFVPSRTCGKPPFLRKTPSPAVSFVSFLQEKKSSPLPFLSRKKRKQKKVICGAVALRCCCLFREHATQNGRFACEPSSFLFRRKEAKENQLRNSFFFCAPAAFTNLLHKTDGSHTNRPFFVPSRTCGKPPFLRKTPSPAMSFVSFLQEKKTFPPFRRKETVPLSRSA